MYNLLLDVDSYKASHFVQYPEGANAMFSYIEARDGRYPETVFFGLQYILNKYLSKPITKDNIDEAEAFFKAHGEPFNRAGWEYILNNYGGYLPVIIRAVPEGMVIPNRNVLVTIKCEDPVCFWVVSYLETLLVRLWYPCTVATVSREAKKIIRDYLLDTADNTDGLMFKLHDFGARGVSSYESSEIGGAAHLVNFMGSDTVPGIRCANRYYHSKMAGFSIPAAEHSTITSWGRANEVEAYRNMLNQFAKPGSLVAVVSDSYDLDYAVNELWGKILKETVVKSGAIVVIRPDSGKLPITVTKCVQDLDKAFGSTINSKGFKVLNNVRVIQGDGIDGCATIEMILLDLKYAGYSADNVAFGMGGGLLQKIDRDTQSFAMKCSAIRVGKEWRDVSKAPKGDPNKRSKGGILDLMKIKGVYQTVDLKNWGWRDDAQPILETVYSMGRTYSNFTLDQVRENAKV